MRKYDTPGHQTNQIENSIQKFSIPCRANAPLLKNGMRHSATNAKPTQMPYQAIQRGIEMAESYRLMILKEEKPEEEVKREQKQEFAEATR